MSLEKKKTLKKKAVKITVNLLKETISEIN